MGLLKLGLAGAAGYAIARKVQNKHHPATTDDRPSYRDTKSGYLHQGHCNGACGRSCNGQQTHGLHDWSCGGQCGGRCAAQQASRGAPAEGWYAAGGEALPGYEGVKA